MKKMLTLIVFLLAFITSTQCVIIGVDVWMKVINGQKYYIYGLNDFHLFQKTNQINDLVNIAKKFPFSEEVLLLAEVNGIPEPKISDTFLSKILPMRPVPSEIFALVVKFVLNNFMAICVDRRITNHFSFRENLLHYYIFGFINQKEMLKKYIKEARVIYDNQCEKILKYDDGIYLNSLYKQFSNSIKYKFNLLIENIEKFDFNNLYQCYFVATMFSLFMEIEALHQIYINPNKKHIFLYFGGMHINHMNSHLINLGYKKIYAYGYKLILLREGYLCTNNEDKLQNPDIMIENAEEASNKLKYSHLNMKDVFDDLNNRFNIFNASNQIVSKL
jgi:hypothetical protein